MFFEFCKQNKIYRKAIVNLYLTFKPDIVKLAEQKVFNYCALADVNLTVVLANNAEPTASTQSRGETSAGKL
jgi:hypothetical protein